MTLSFARPAIALALAAVLAGCASTNGGEGFAASDPYEGFNRKMHAFNVGVDENVLRPVAIGYDTVTPALFQHLIGNGLRHLDLPKDFANQMLQGEVQAGLRTLGRFVINTAVGMGGLLDPATEFGLPKETTDFGVTLGKAGVEEGPYLVLPLLGPSNPRDLGGAVVDRAFQPTTYVGYYVDGAGMVPPAVGALGVVDERNRNADLIDEVLYGSPDSYVALRSIYLQRRRALVAGDDAGAALPDIFDDEGAP
jgi:phospholipid-binding lipoprotein MlaA